MLQQTNSRLMMPAAPSPSPLFAGMTAPLTIRANFAWALWGNLVTAGSQWLMIVMLARIADPSVLGQYTLALAIVAPVFLLASLNLRTMQITGAIANFQFEDYLGVRLATAAAATVVSVAAAAALRYPLAIVGAMACLRAIEAVGEAFHGEFQRGQRMDWIAGSITLRSTFLIAALLAVAGTHGLAWALAASGPFAAGVLCLYDWRRLPVAAHIVSMARIGSNLRKIAVLGGQLGVVLMLVSLNSYVCRYWLAAYRGEHDVGILSALTCLPIAANTIVMAMAQASVPAMSVCLDRGDIGEFRHKSIRMVQTAVIAAVTCLVGARVWGAEVLTLLYGPDYATHANALLWLTASAALGFLATAAGYTLSAARWLRIQLPILVVTLAALSIASIRLIPSGGVLGAAQAQLAGIAVQMLLNFAAAGLLYHRMRKTSIKS